MKESYKVINFNIKQWEIGLSRFLDENNYTASQKTKILNEFVEVNNEIFSNPVIPESMDIHFDSECEKCQQNYDKIKLFVDSITSPIITVIIKLICEKALQEPQKGETE